MEQEELVANSLVTTERTVSRFASKFSPSFSPSLGGGILVSQTGRTGTVSVRIKRKLVRVQPDRADASTPRFSKELLRCDSSSMGHGGRSCEYRARTHIAIA